MKNTKLSGTICLLFVIALMIGFFWNNRSVINPEEASVSYDELVYWQLAGHLKKGLAYNCIPAAEFIQKKAPDKELPDYFHKPLFKHPPFFPFLASLPMRLFGNGFLNALTIPLLMGSLVILFTYLLAKDLFGYNVAILSALFVYLDTVVNLCSQKLWMDMTLSFLALASVYFFIRALKLGKGRYFILSAFMVGLSINTRYTGGLILPAFIAYAFLFDRTLFKNPSFLNSLTLPFLMIIPWILIYFGTYGLTGIKSHEELRIFYRQVYPFAVCAVLWGISIYCTYLILRKSNKYDALKQVVLNFFNHEIVKMIVKTGFVLGLLFVLRIHFIRSLDLFFVPRTSIQVYSFIDEPRYFYFGRLLEYSFLYVFSYLAFFIGLHQRSHSTAILKLAAGFNLIFFIAWGNYQCRYIVPAVPFLIILGVACWQWMMDFLIHHFPPWLSFPARVVLRLLLVFIILRTILLNYHFAYHQIACYF